jgi:hypothetical protein
MLFSFFCLGRIVKLGADFFCRLQGNKMMLDCFAGSDEDAD